MFNFLPFQLPNLEERPFKSRSREQYYQDEEDVVSSVELKRFNQDYFNPSHSNRLNTNRNSNLNVKTRGTATTTEVPTTTKRSFASQEVVTTRPKARYSPFTR